MRNYIEFADWTRQWLFEAALPLWWERGADQSTGGFHDSLSIDGKPQGKPDRLRVQTRQLYVYSQAGQLGWNGPWLAATRHAAATLGLYRRSDGFYSSRLSSPDQVDLYDQSFVLFALAHLYAAEGGATRARLEAEKLVLNLDRFRCADGAFWDRFPINAAARRSNPLMHLLEAALAWRDVGVGGVFAALIDELAELGLGLFSSGYGGIGEDFDAGWKPTMDCRYEPGHQFEWCYLLHRAGVGTPSVLEGLYRCGSRATGPEGAPFGMDSSGRVTDRRQRLWAQTERLRTAAYFHFLPAPQKIAQSIDLEQSMSVVRRLLSHPVPGLWYEWQDESGALVLGPCPATSLYHIMTAFSSLSETVGSIQALRGTVH